MKKGLFTDARRELILLSAAAATAPTAAALAAFAGLRQKNDEFWAFSFEEGHATFRVRKRIRTDLDLTTLAGSIRFGTDTIIAPGWRIATTIEWTEFHGKWRAIHIAIRRGTTAHDRRPTIR